MLVKYSDHIYYSYFFLNYYILKGLFCFRSRVFNFLEHKEVSDRKTSLSLRESNFFYDTWMLIKKPSTDAYVEEHGFWTVHPVIACQLLFNLDLSLYLGGDFKSVPPVVPDNSADTVKSPKV